MDELSKDVDPSGSGASNWLGQCSVCSTTVWLEGPKPPHDAVVTCGQNSCKTAPFPKPDKPSGGTKHDTLKARQHLIPMEAWPKWYDAPRARITQTRGEVRRWALKHVPSEGTTELGCAIVCCAHVMCPPAPEAAMQHEVARVLAFGASKYGANNWRGGFKWTRLSDAVDRHLAAYERGEVTDPESGLPHLAHAVCTLLFLITHIQDGLGEDDR